MTDKEIEEHVARLKAWLGAHREDLEAAHAEEEEPLLLVLKAIANGKTRSARRLAKKALESANLDFPRWMA